MNYLARSPNGTKDTHLTSSAKHYSSAHSRHDCSRAPLASDYRNRYNTGSYQLAHWCSVSRLGRGVLLETIFVWTPHWNVSAHPVWLLGLMIRPWTSMQSWTRPLMTSLHWFRKLVWSGCVDQTRFAGSSRESSCWVWAGIWDWAIWLRDRLSGKTDFIRLLDWERLDRMKSYRSFREDGSGAWFGHCPWLIS